MKDLWNVDKEALNDNGNTLTADEEVIRGDR